MTVSLNQEGFWPSFFRFFKSTGVLLLVDAVLSVTALCAVLLLLATLARAEGPPFDGESAFEAVNGYPKTAPSFNGSYDGEGGGFDAWWYEPGAVYIESVNLMGQDAL
ncbi:MAG: hypothetical protein LBQ12_04515, partial [Deltaproteobacteria bacterium]|nr:hypothetical protein [Deltaproteobacteria bacterium]